MIETKKKIYIIVTYTGTILSKIIKQFTKAEYSHVSIALDEKLEKMYSFGRLNPYNPVWGGFVHEGINIGTFKRFKNTIAKVISIEISKEQYEKICTIIEMINRNKKHYNFNIIGLFAVGINKKIQRINTFYCAEFVKYVLEQANVDLGLPSLIKPEDFKNLDNTQKGKLEYVGKLKEYTHK